MIGILANQKGGVAKTTNTIHMGSALSKKGFKTLLIDFDPQCDLSHGVGITKNDSYNVVDFIENNGNFKLKEKAPNFYILPGSVDFDTSNYKVDSLKKALDRDINGMNVKEYFDYILIDCPPSKVTIPVPNKKNTLTELNIALYSADFFLIPLKSDDFSIKNANRFLGNIISFNEYHKLEIDFIGFFFGCILVTENAFSDYYNTVKKHAGNLLFNTYIRQDVQVKYAVSKGKTIFQFKPNCRASKDYIQFTDEFLNKINDGE